MANTQPVRGAAEWLLHQLSANYWLAPAAATIGAIPLTFGLIALDRADLARMILASDGSPVASASAASELASAAVGTAVALVALYFSITLLILTIATSNLGVRLIDRWLQKRLVRACLASLSFGLVSSLIVLAAVDPDAAMSELPLGALWLILFIQTANMVMLAFALHDLGRTMFVDRSVLQLSEATRATPCEVVAGEGYDGDWQTIVAAPREGYVEGTDLERLTAAMRNINGPIRLVAAPGQHILEGEPLVCIASNQPFAGDLDKADVLRCVPIGPYRSSGQGAVFHVRLMVEIAARALSPAINDLYTALTVADRLAAAMIAQRTLWVEPDATPVYRAHSRIEVPGQDFKGIYDSPLAVFRQSAADYPAVAIRLVETLHRVARGPGSDTPVPDTFEAYLFAHAERIANDAVAGTRSAFDKDAIRASLERWKSARRTTDNA